MDEFNISNALDRDDELFIKVINIERDKPYLMDMVDNMQSSCSKSDALEAINTSGLSKIIYKGL